MKPDHSATPLHGLCVFLAISQIRRDGYTQGRIFLNPAVVTEYANLMRAGCQFPPIRVWFDHVNYWLSDGFHRVAAAESNGTAEIFTEVFDGTLEAARWDSYCSNTTHGLRRSKADIDSLIARTLKHPNCKQLSN